MSFMYASTIAQDEKIAENVKEEQITLSFSFTPAKIKAKWIAEVPLLNATILEFADNFSSFCSRFWSLNHKSIPC